MIIQFKMHETTQVMIENKVRSTCACEAAGPEPRPQTCVRGDRGGRRGVSRLARRLARVGCVLARAQSHHTVRILQDNHYHVCELLIAFIMRRGPQIRHKCMGGAGIYNRIITTLNCSNAAANSGGTCACCVAEQTLRARVPQVTGFASVAGHSASSVNSNSITREICQRFCRRA